MRWLTVGRPCFPFKRLRGLYSRHARSHRTIPAAARGYRGRHRYRDQPRSLWKAHRSSPHALVSIASALLVMLAGELGSGTPDHAAASRIIQGIVGGIGFLGAGVILRADKGNRVYHINTAATIWVTADLGTA